MACSSQQPIPVATDNAPNETDPSPEIHDNPSAEVTPKEIYPGITLNLQERYVDVRATVVGRDVEWLELLACRPGSREYESVVAVDADAAQLRIALTLLGLEPGAPGRAVADENNQLVFYPPTGPALALFFILDDQPDTLIPANDWVVDQKNHQRMPGNTWVFTGSTFIEYQGRQNFMAEVNGTVVSLLNFGDELVSRPTNDSEAGGTDQWTANTDAIPPLGTKLTLRFQPAAEE